MKAENCKVCVTGGAGYIGSWLVKELLTRGYIVHTTLRNLNDESKVGLLKSFPYAETRLVMFQADIFDPNTFEPAIQGCQFVLHVATPVTTSYDFQVCVTGGAGYIGSWLVKELLTRGYIVHTTLRNLNDESKVGLLKSFPYAETRLVMFQADIFDPNTFEPAIQGCQFVLHVATPVTTSYDFQSKNMIEATIRAAKSIKMFCARSGTVKRLIYSSSVVAASPLKDDGTGFKDTMDETCWTPFNLSFSYSNDDLKGYVESKLLTEKEILNYGDGDGGRLEVVSLALGLVAGDSVLPRTPQSVSVCISQLTNNEPLYQALRFLEELLGKLPLVHIGDVSEAFFFCMEQPSITGRFLCVSSYVSSAEIVEYYRLSYPEFHVKQEYSNLPKREIKWGSMKLLDQGFKYKYDMKMALDDCIKCARRNNDLQF